MGFPKWRKGEHPQVEVPLMPMGKDKKPEKRAPFASRYKQLKQDKECHNLHQLIQRAQSSAMSVSSTEQLETMRNTLVEIRDHYDEAIDCDSRIKGFFRRIFPFFFEREDRESYHSINRAINTIMIKERVNSYAKKCQGGSDTANELFFEAHVKKNAETVRSDIKKPEKIAALLTNDEVKADFEKRSKEFVDAFLAASGETPDAEWRAMVSSYLLYKDAILKQDPVLGSERDQDLMMAAFLAQSERLPAVVVKMTGVFAADYALIESPNGKIFCEALDMACGVDPKELVHPSVLPQKSQKEREYRSQILTNCGAIEAFHRSNDPEEAKRFQSGKIIALLDDEEFVEDAIKLYTEFAKAGIGGARTEAEKFGDRFNELIVKKHAKKIGVIRIDEMGGDDQMLLFEACALAAKDHAPDAYFKLKGLDPEVIFRAQNSKEMFFLNFFSIMSYVEQGPPKPPVKE